MEMQLHMQIQMPCEMALHALSVAHFELYGRTDAELDSTSYSYGKGIKVYITYDRGA